jgi:hypothetical protein
MLQSVSEGLQPSLHTRQARTGQARTLRIRDYYLNPGTDPPKSSTEHGPLSGPFRRLFKDGTRWPKTRIGTANSPNELRGVTR